MGEPNLAGFGGSLPDVQSTVQSTAALAKVEGHAKVGRETLSSRDVRRPVPRRPREGGRPGEGG
jgi:hypothetical protein